MGLFQDILEKWEGTPYREGHRILRQGVDCVQFVAAVLEEFYGVPCEIPRLSSDVAYFNKGAGYPAMSALRRSFPYTKTDPSSEIEAGDVIVTTCGSAGTLPHHVLIASDNPVILFHAMKSSGVCRTPACCWEPKIIYRRKRI